MCAVLHQQTKGRNMWCVSANLLLLPIHTLLRPRGRVLVAWHIIFLCKGKENTPTLTAQLIQTPHTHSHMTLIGVQSPMQLLHPNQGYVTTIICIQCPVYICIYMYMYMHVQVHMYGTCTNICCMSQVLYRLACNQALLLRGKAEKEIGNGKSEEDGVLHSS